MCGSVLHCRLVLLFRRAYKRNDKPVCLGTARHATMVLILHCKGTINPNNGTHNCKEGSSIHSRVTHHHLGYQIIKVRAPHSASELPRTPLPDSTAHLHVLAEQGMERYALV
jgi:hypothetical protein